MNQSKNSSNNKKKKQDIQPLEGFEIGKEGQGWKEGKNNNLDQVDRFVAPILYDMGFDISLENTYNNKFLVFPFGRKDISIETMIYKVPSLKRVKGKIYHSIPHSVCKVTEEGKERILFMLEHDLKDCYILIILRTDAYLFLKTSHFLPEDWNLEERQEPGDRMLLKGGKLKDSYVIPYIQKLKDELNTIFKNS